MQLRRQEAIWTAHGPHRSRRFPVSVEDTPHIFVRVVVVAAGNQGRNNSLGTQGYGTIQAPGNDPYVITVGAMNTMGQGFRQRAD
jgi:hypothetical protein